MLQATIPVFDSKKDKKGDSENVTVGDEETSLADIFKEETWR